MSFLAPLFFAGLAALAVPILVHLIQRERKEVVQFPSLMFLRRIPYQSVERRRIHNWLLLVLRAGGDGADRRGVRAAVLQAGSGQGRRGQRPARARSSSCSIDSASMGYGDHWDARARPKRRRSSAGSAATTARTLVLFGSGTEENVRATSDRGRLDGRDRRGQGHVRRDALRPGAAAGAEPADASRRCRARRPCLISDFQKTRLGAAGGDPPARKARRSRRCRSPTSRRRICPCRRSRCRARRSRARSASRRPSASPTAAPTPFTNVPVKLEIDGREIDTPPGDPRPERVGVGDVPAVHGRRGEHARHDPRRHRQAAADNVFNFVLSPSRPVSVLDRSGRGRRRRVELLPDDGARDRQRAAVQGRRRCRVVARHADRRSSAARSSSSTTRRALPTRLDDQLKRFVEQGGGLFVVARRAHARGPARVAAAARHARRARRSHGRRSGGTLGFLDYSHPVFEQFKDPRQGNFATARFLRYRIAAARADRSRCSRGSTTAASAMAERKVGARPRDRLHVDARRRRGTTSRSSRCSCRSCTS